MNYSIYVLADTCRIMTTGAATDGSTVFGSLKMARAALDDAVTLQIARIQEHLDAEIDRLRDLASKDRNDLRAARKAALKVREADLPSEPAAPAEAA